MGFIIDFIEFIGSTIQSVWSFFTGSVRNLLNLIKYLGIAFKFCVDFIGTLPDFVQAFAMMTITVIVLYQVLGRDKGGS